MAPLSDVDLAPFNVSCVFGACRRQVDQNRAGDNRQQVNQTCNCCTELLSMVLAHHAAAVA